MNSKSSKAREWFARAFPILEAELSLGENNPDFRGLKDLNARHAFAKFSAGFDAALATTNEGLASARATLAEQGIVMKFLLMESTNDHTNIHSPHAEWGVSFTSSNPEAEDYVACKTEWDARRLCNKLNGMLSALAATVECSIYETQVLPTIAAAVRAPELVKDRTTALAIPEAIAQPAALSDAECFRYLQNLPVVEAQAFFWNYESRSQRKKAIREAMAATSEARTQSGQSEQSCYSTDAEQAARTETPTTLYKPKD